MRLSKLIEVNWRTARLMLKKLRQAMAHRDSLYQLSGLIEVDDALVGGKRSGKRGRGATGKTPVLIACESKKKQAGYVAMKTVDSVSHNSVKEFVSKRVVEGQEVHTDGLEPHSISWVKCTSMKHALHRQAKSTNGFPGCILRSAS